MANTNCQNFTVEKDCCYDDTLQVPSIRTNEITVRGIKQHIGDLNPVVWSTPNPNPNNLPATFPLVSPARMALNTHYYVNLANQTLNPHYFSLPAVKDAQFGDVIVFEVTDDIPNGLASVIITSDGTTFRKTSKLTRTNPAFSATAYPHIDVVFVMNNANWSAPSTKTQLIFNGGTQGGGGRLSTVTCTFLSDLDNVGSQYGQWDISANSILQGRCTVSDTSDFG